jgi:hypothetical protein
MANIFDEVRGILISQQSCFLRVGYGSQIKVGLGEKIFYNSPKLKGKFYGEWDIVSDSCVWRVVKEEKILCGYGDEIKYCNEVFESIQLDRIKDILQITPMDFSIVFETGLRIDYLCESTDGTVLSIFDNKNKVVFELTLDGWIKSSSNESFGKLTELESILSQHSEECQNRWEAFISVNESNNQCMDCFYFRGITGGFYFWDYGICSNEKSKFDGKLVNVESGCCSFNQLKDIYERT